MKTLLVAMALALVGIGYWLVSPFFVDEKVSESLPVGVESSIVQKGEFEGFDSVHTGSGDVSVIKTTEGYILRFEDNFKVANGPDLYVGFGKNGKYQKGTELARLKGNIGSQNYIVPYEINLDEYNEIWIWCKAFSVGFAKATLK